jgi:hypothetical protein
MQNLQKIHEVIFVQHLEKKNVGYKLRLSQELYNLKMEEGTLMQIHINKF